MKMSVKEDRWWDVEIHNEGRRKTRMWVEVTTVLRHYR